jgi:hypothetical protein
MKTIRELVAARKTLLGVAEFFHSVTHKGKGLKPGTDITEVARSLRIAIPPSLRGSTITATKSRTTGRGGSSVVVHLGGGPPPTGLTVVRCYKIEGRLFSETYEFNVCVFCNTEMLTCTVKVGDVDTHGPAQ